MHEICGQRINLRRQSIFSARIELHPAAIFVNATKPEVDNERHLYSSAAHCTLSFESWSFQNRIMVNFEEVAVKTNKRCYEPNLEILDGPTEESPRVAGEYQ